MTCEISPEVMFFFRDELEKRAGTPSMALNMMKHRPWDPSLAARARRGIGQQYTKAFGSGGILNPERMMRINRVAHAANDPKILAAGPEFALASVKALAKGEAIRGALPGIKKVIPKVKAQPQIADALTWYEANVPSNMFDNPIYDAVKQHGGAIGRAFGL